MAYVAYTAMVFAMNTPLVLMQPSHAQQSGMSPLRHCAQSCEHDLKFSCRQEVRKGGGTRAPNFVLRSSVPRTLYHTFVKFSEQFITNNTTIVLIRMRLNWQNISNLISAGSYLKNYGDWGFLRIP